MKSVLPVLERSAAGLLRDMRWPAAAMGWPGPGKVAPPGGAPGNLPPSIGCPEPSLQHPCPAFVQVTVSILKCVISSTHLEKVSGVTRGALLSCSMASCGEGAGKGSTRLGGLPGLTVRRSHQTPCQYCTVLYCTV